MSTAPDAAKADPKAAKKAAAPAKADKADKADKAVKAVKAVKAADKPTPAPKPAKAAKAPAPKKAAKPATTRPAHDPSRLAQVLVAPIISEKATHVAEKHNQILFKVLRSATKPEIKAAVEQMWPGKTVVSVQTVQHKGKEKRFGKSNGRRDHVKKAYVCLAAGQELNFSGEGA
jgi:large subunit ribosomal protein L23